MTNHIKNYKTANDIEVGDVILTKSGAQIIISGIQVLSILSTGEPDVVIHYSFLRQDPITDEWKTGTGTVPPNQLKRMIQN